MAAPGGIVRIDCEGAGWANQRVLAYEGPRHRRMRPRRFSNAKTRRPSCRDLYSKHGPTKRTAVAETNETLKDALEDLGGSDGIPGGSLAKAAKALE